jgi:hypothetical protein
MATKVFVSPGVYTSERDLSFITRQVGVTTLGLVGETTIGPAFQPIFITNYGEFKSFFGGLNATKVRDTGAPQYELPYIAKSYLSQSNQLFVTRVLGFSGYKAGQAWGITIDANVDTSTVGQSGSTITETTQISYTADSSNVITNLVVNNTNLNTFVNDSVLTVYDDLVAWLPFADTGSTANFGTYYRKPSYGSNSFDGIAYTATVKTRTSDVNGVTGVTSGYTALFTGTSYTDADNRLIALLRSRGAVNTSTQLPDYEVNDPDGIIMYNQNLSSGPSTAITSTLTGLYDPLGDFAISGYSNTQGNFINVLSFDKTKKNYITRALGRTPLDGNTPLFVEEYYNVMFENLVADDKVYGINSGFTKYDTEFDDYLKEYQPAVTPYVVSELRGTKVLKLFRFWTISDGNAANEQFKISIRNINLDTREFDVAIRGYYDTDAQPVVLETFSRCTMDPTSNNYIARRIGTLDGEYPSKSSYVLIEMDDSSDTSEAFPSGFIGYPVRDYQANSNSTTETPYMTYKKTYSTFENKRKAYLGLSDTVGIDSDFFDYKGVPQTADPDIWTGLTDGFHMDVDATGATIDNYSVPTGSGTTYNPVILFETGDWQFRTNAGLNGGPYEKIYARKFTFAPYGGFDGWDAYRTRRSNLDSFLINGTYGTAGRTSGAFAYKTLTNGDLGINSDYYAYLEAIWTFKNPEAVNINVFATPGIDNFDNTNLIEATIDMVETDRADSLYIMTTPDLDAGGQVMSAADVTDFLDGMYDSNYSCTYWPWIQVNDTENNVYIYMPPTRDVVRNIALTDNIAFSWFAVAGIQRGDVDAIQARKKLTLAERDTLYDGRINPIATFTSDGIKIWGNKTLQVKDTALNRINVRRLLLQARKLISAVSIRLLFEQNDSVVRNQFLALVNPILDNIRTQRGLYDFRVVLSNDPEDFDRNQLTGQIFLKPTRALEFIQLEFVIMNTGASFDNI